MKPTQKRSVEEEEVDFKVDNTAHKKTVEWSLLGLQWEH